MASKTLKELRDDLRYFQMQVRMEARWLQQSREKCKRIGAEMRRVQAEKKARGGRRAKKV